MLKQLLQIKQLREHSAQQKVNTRIRALDQAVHAQQQAEQALQDYIQWRCGKEAQLFADIQHQTVALDDIEKLNLHIGLLRQKDVQLEQAVQQSQTQRETAVELLAQARTTHQALMKSTEKTTQLLEREQHMQRQQDQYREEAEHEEFSRQKLDGLQ